jgi:kynurenine formamidase
LQFHARGGVLVQYVEGMMHRGTHMDAPIHVQALDHGLGTYMAPHGMGPSIQRRRPT